MLVVQLRMRAEQANFLPRRKREAFSRRASSTTRSFLSFEPLCSTSSTSAASMPTSGLRL